MDTPETQTAVAKTGVVAKLRAQKAAKAGVETFTLGSSGVEVAMPRFKPYSAWARATRLAAGDQDRAQIIYLIGILTFDGEKLTLDDYRELIDAPDHLQILGKVYGGGKSEETAAAGEKDDGEGAAGK